MGRREGEGVVGSGLWELVWGYAWTCWAYAAKTQTWTMVGNE